MSTPARITRLLDTVPCVPVGEAYIRATTPPADGRRLAIGPARDLPTLADPELYRMHTQPQHYFPEQIHTADDARVALLDTVFPGECADWDCHACHTTVATAVPARGPVRCPVCYTRQP